MKIKFTIPAENVEACKRTNESGLMTAHIQTNPGDILNVTLDAFRVTDHHERMMNYYQFLAGETDVLLESDDGRFLLSFLVMKQGLSVLRLVRRN